MAVAFLAAFSFSPWPAEPKTPQPGPIDIGFAQHMSRHHDQAIAMAEFYLQGEAGSFAGLARRIQHTQLLELGQMRGWLGLWNRPQVPISRSMDWMLAGIEPPDERLRRYLLSCEQAEGGMPGLASAEELQSLATAQSTERDRLFLEMMIRHHQGGLPMLDFASREAGVPVVQELATRMLADQTRETVVLRRALNTLGTP